MKDVNKRLCELLGCDVPRPSDVCPLCGKTNTDGNKFIDGADFFSEKGRIYLLRRMREREDWIEFCDRYLSIQGNFVPVSMILDDTGALARAALEFIEGKTK